MKATDPFADYLEVGFCKKSFGIKGQIRFVLSIKQGFQFDDLKHFFFKLKGCMVPFFIDHRQSDLDNELIKFDWIDNPEDADQLSNQSVYLKKDQIDTVQMNQPSDLLVFNGYNLLNQEGEDFGTIFELLEYPEQILANVKHLSGRTFLIPLHQDNILSMDHEVKQIMMQIPEGILDI